MTVACVTNNLAQINAYKIHVTVIYKAVYCLSNFMQPVKQRITPSHMMLQTFEVDFSIAVRVEYFNDALYKRILLKFW